MFYGAAIVNSSAEFQRKGKSKKEENRAIQSKIVAVALGATRTLPAGKRLQCCVPN